MPPAKWIPPTPFLSTPSARRATCDRCLEAADAWISIHALREEGDCELWCPCGPPVLFLSTPSARRATFVVQGTGGHEDISIHALREEGDLTYTGSTQSPT